MPQSPARRHASTTEPALDPRVVRSRKVILAAATEHFLANGFLNAKVDEIAADAQVSKRTIYNIFGGKEALFREILADSFRTAERFAAQAAAVLTDTEDVAAELRAAAVRLARAVLSPNVIRLRRLIIGEAERFPDIATDYYRRAPGLVMDTLATALRRLNRRGALRVRDARLAAEHFAFLVMGAPLDRALFGTRDELPTDADVEARAVEGVAVFLRAYSRDAPRQAGGRK